MAAVRSALVSDRPEPVTRMDRPPSSLQDSRDERGTTLRLPTRRRTSWATWSRFIRPQTTACPSETGHPGLFTRVSS